MNTLRRNYFHAMRRHRSSAKHAITNEISPTAEKINYNSFIGANTTKARAGAVLLRGNRAFYHAPPSASSSRSQFGNAVKHRQVVFQRRHLHALHLALIITAADEDDLLKIRDRFKGLAFSIIHRPALQFERVL